MANGRRVIVTGATGSIGRKLCARIEAKGYRVVVFSRDPERARRTMRSGSEFVVWEPSESGQWASAIEGAYGVVHLAGANLFSKRWSDAYKREIIESRRIGTRGLVNAMRQANNKPEVFVSSSAIHYYGQRDNTELDESGQAGDDFLAEVVKAWEHEALLAEELGIRTVVIRTGIVLSGDNQGRVPFALDVTGFSPSRPGFVLDTEAGALPLMALPFRLMVGGPIGSGKQWFAWIHVDDVVGLMLMALEDERARGPINATAPQPLTSREFSKTLGNVMNRPSWFPVPGFGLRALLGPVAVMLTDIPRVVPRKAQELGYQFKYPTAEAALRNLMRK